MCGALPSHGAPSPSRLPWRPAPFPVPMAPSLSTLLRRPSIPPLLQPWNTNMVSGSNLFSPFPGSFDFSAAANQAKKSAVRILCSNSELSIHGVSSSPSSVRLLPALLLHQGSVTL
ncbi:hypothetical protein VPH35_017882 [Triticum aestivum]